MTNSPYNVCNICKIELKLLEYCFLVNIHTGESYCLCNGCFTKQRANQVKGTQVLRVYDQMDRFSKEDYEGMLKISKYIPSRLPK